ncbi:MAG: ThiF family adenylyltransferase [Gammaproteobacteria bacterium]
MYQVSNLSPLTFGYSDAFSRSIGLMTREEQVILHSCRVAIAGMGGVGGCHLLTHTRLGVGQFHIADFDNFDIVNFNRQAGATVSHLGKSKVQMMAAMARDINPTLQIKTFDQGVTLENLDAFLDGVDVYIDGLDFFAVDIRKAVFAACWEKKIPAVTVAPLGMSVALLNFIPPSTSHRGGSSFEQYFCLKGQPLEEQYLRFLIGLAPRGLHRNHIVDPSTINLAEHRGPSVPMAIELAAGVAATESLKIMLKRGRVLAAPHGVQFDALNNRIVRTWRLGGMHNPLQKLTLTIARKQIKRMLAATPASPPAKNDPPVSDVIQQILHLARWAPSGDNAQPWRFEVLADDHFVIRGSDTSELGVYDLQGRGNQLALGILLETVRIAATGSSMQAAITRRTDAPDQRLVFDVKLTQNPNITTDPLLKWISSRVTQRRAMKRRRLTEYQIAQLDDAVGPDHSVQWFAGRGMRFKLARLLSASGKIRLTIPEAYQVHQNVIQWHSRYSPDRIPDQALGLDPMGLMLMRWAMKSWGRVNMLNRFAGGTWLPRLQLDFLPGLRCAAHFVITAKKQPETIDDFLTGGAAIQRFWLTAASLGLQLQPEITPAFFSNYARDNVPFSQAPHAMPAARRVRQRLCKVIGEPTLDELVFMGRIGQGKVPSSRSTRLSVHELRNLEPQNMPQ